MPNSLTFSSRGGKLAATAVATPQLTQTLVSGDKITVLGHEFPEHQVVGVKSTTALTLPAPSITCATPLKEGQCVTIVNMGSMNITFPLNAFNTGSQPEVLSPKQMIQLIWKIPVGWIPMDDDAASDQLPLTLWNGANTMPANGRMLLHEKGMVLAKGALPLEPIARLQTSSIATKLRTTGSNYTFDTEDHTVVLMGGSSTFTLPNPTTCPGRELRIISEMAVIPLVVTGGSQVRTGQSAVITSVLAGKGLTIQSTGLQWRKVAEC